MSTEGIWIALLGLVASVVTAAVAARRDAKTTAQALYTQLCDDQQRRIQQLQERLERNEAELEQLRREQATMRAENETLRNRVRALEDERAELLAEIAKLKSCRGMA